MGFICTPTVWASVKSQRPGVCWRPAFIILDRAFMGSFTATHYSAVIRYCVASSHSSSSRINLIQAMDSLMMIAPGLETEPGAIRHEADSRTVYLQRLERSTFFAVGFVSLTAANKYRILLFTRKIHILQSS